ncbi:MAG: hypothetical protein A2Y41_00290 [Spirochaetes bacterium GWB1_36_13]|nr:MAG: hypothetical protein A2Y41_00290 [Spirochaetes bacterium GWB1_36_13]
MKFFFFFLISVFCFSCQPSVKPAADSKEVKKNAPVVEKTSEKQYSFTYKGEAKSVFLTGNFNKWSVDHPEYKMTEKEKNEWIITVPESLLIKGKNEYKFVADSEWKINPEIQSEESGLSGKINILVIQ